MGDMKNTVLLLVAIVLIAVMALTTQHAVAAGLERIKYNNPGLVVDLGVGLWAMPLPMDFDGDGDNDLVVATRCKPDNGIYFFENTSGDVRFPIFKPGIRLSYATRNMQISYVGDSYHILTPGRYYPDFKAKFLRDGGPVPYKKAFYAGRANHWKFCDYDGDEVIDLVMGASDWRGYGWDDAYDSDGVWTRDRLHGYVYFIKNVGTNEEPEYGEALQIKTGEDPLDVYGNPHPNLADWDKDGDLDIVCGEFLDKLTYFENIGTRKGPRYAKGRFLTYEGKIIKMDLEMIAPVALDWDKDGSRYQHIQRTAPGNMILATPL